MRKLMRIFSLLLVFALFLPAAFAEDVCVVPDAFAAGHVTTKCPYLQVQCELPEATTMLLSVHDEWGTLIYQRNYGLCSGVFRSRDVHLPAEGEDCDYTITLTTGLGEYTFVVTREQPLITNAAVYAGGLTLEEMNGGSPYKYAVVLDLYALDEMTVVAPMMADGCRIGDVCFTVADGALMVSAALEVQGQIDKARVYVAADAITASTLGKNRFTGLKAKLDEEIPLGDVPYAAVMVQLTVTYAGENIHPFVMEKEDEKAYEQLLENWQLMQMVTANEAVG